jgi:general secretion pathway protein G
MFNQVSERPLPARAVHRGFTMVELLMVIIVIAILMALLLPAINSALKAARRAAVLSEINQLAQALANFKAKYGDYPPSRFLAIETGDYTTALQSSSLALNTNFSVPSLGQYDPYSPGDGDITVAQLAQRSVAAIRKFWPRVNTSTGASVLTYDFNGNGQLDNPYVMHGHECLVFFLGGIPALNTSSGTYSMIGFDKNPQNPFTNYAYNSTNRQAPFFEFNPGRLFLDLNSGSQVPGYYDSFGNNSPPATAGLVPSTLNFYAYFSAYGNNGYDPNDVNFGTDDPSAPFESDSQQNGPIGLLFATSFGTFSAISGCNSYSPNPYTTAPTTTVPLSYINPQSFQIISAGIDGLYGVGGQYVSNATSTAVVPIPADLANTYFGATNGKSLSFESAQTVPDGSIRLREADNLTNFKGGTLQ